jgi:hypothetical protein
MAPPTQRHVLESMLVGLGGLVGVAFTAWGLRILFVGITNFDPQSELPRWLAFVLGGPILLVGLWLLLLVRSARQRDHSGAQT